MKLLIISHTEHYKNSDGEIVGWGSTITELNHLTDIFDEVHHCAPLNEGIAPLSSLPYISSKIKFIPLKPYGGDTLLKKLSVLTTAPHNLRIIRRSLKDVDIFQFRAPTGMGIYVIPWLMYLSGKKGWFKYAGNWKQPNPPLGYRIQKRYLVQNSKFHVTINGKWDDQPDHCLTFENPCLTQEELAVGEDNVSNKDYSGKLNFIFVGRLEKAKGVYRILDAFGKIDSDRIGKIHLIGDGDERELFEEIAAKTGCDIVFHGFLPQNRVFELYKQSHIFLLPSDSEGFPKVLAEAANFGSIPIVSDISCLSDYVTNGKEGWLFDLEEVDALKSRIINVLDSPGDELYNIARKIQKQSNLFTFEYYNYRIKNELL